MMKQNANVAVVAYVPSPHRGYVEFFEKYEGATLYVLGKELIDLFPALTRHLPANDPVDVVQMVDALGLFQKVRVLTPATIYEVLTHDRIVMPDEDVSIALQEKFFPETLIQLDGSWRLRWDSGAVQKQLRPEDERVISVDELDQELMRTAFAAADRSSDWWRQVGAVLVRDGEVQLIAFNKHMPSEHSPYLNGDPRSNFGPGQQIDMSSALHAEIGVIAEAANRGISTNGRDLYVTTFPCPPCARACAQSGIKRLYYCEGYSLIEGAEALRSRGVEIIRVEMNTPSP